MSTQIKPWTGFYTTSVTLPDDLRDVGINFNADSVEIRIQSRYPTRTDVESINMARMHWEQAVNPEILYEFFNTETVRVFRHLCETLAHLDSNYR